MDVGLLVRTSAGYLAEVSRDDEPPDVEGGVGGALLKARVKSALLGAPRPAVLVDRFALLERMGAGGMGEVYSAFDPRLEREVAIKLLRPDPHAQTEEARDRLVREARSMARVSHPNVVQVYEIGIAGEQVFVTMELIRGGTLQERLGRPERDWRTIRELFLAAGRGLEAAHCAGLVHRDFKPSNVLIAKDGRVAVADFGLARLTSNLRAADASGAPPPADLPRVSAGARLTESATLVGTPAYAAPEQMSGRAPGAAADQFSFCVALSEALRGAKRVPAWLRTAVERGLAYAPEDRYPDMSALLAAITLDQRRRLQGGLTAAVLGLGLFAGAVAAFGVRAPLDPCASAGAALDAVWNDGSRRSVENALSRLDRSYAAATASRVRDLLDDYGEQWKRAQIAACEETEVQHIQPAEVLALRTACLGRAMQALSALLSALSNADADTLERAIEGAASLPAPNGCGDVEALLHGPRPPADEQTARRVETLRRALAEVRAAEVTGHWQQGRERAVELVAQAQSIAYPPVEAEVFAAAGRLLARKETEASHARAEELLWTGLDLAESHRYDRLAVDLWNDLAQHASRRGSTQEQARLFARRAEAALVRAGTPPEARLATLANRARIEFRDRRLEDSERLLREALDDVPAASASRPAAQLLRAELLQELANTVADRGRAEEAEAVYAEALGDLTAALGAAHPNVAALSLDFGIFLSETGRFERAEAALKSALELWTAIDGPRHRNAGVCRLALANLEQARGRLAEAEAYAHEAHAISEETLPADHPDRAEAASVLGLVLFRRERFKEAEALWREALELQRRTLANDDPTIALTLSNIAEARIELGDPQGALRIVQDLEPVARAMTAELPVLLALVLSGRGRARLIGAEVTAAEADLVEAEKLWRALPAYPLDRAETIWALARARRFLRRSYVALAEDAARNFEQHGRPEKAEKIRAWLAQ